MYPALLQPLLFFATLSLSLTQSCDTAINVNRIITPTGRLLEKYQDDHEVAGLTRECIETAVPVEKNSVRCFKWRLRTNQVQLDERRVSSQSLVTEVPNEVTFRSPGFYRESTKHYSNSMFCVYNISLDNCIHVTVSSSIGHTLYNDSIDYLSVYLGDRSPRLYGDEVGTFADDTSSGSLYAVLWSNAENHTSRGTFELTARCHSQNTANIDNGSGSLHFDM